MRTERPLEEINDLERLEIERWHKKNDAFHALFSGGLKGLAFLNSGGVVTILGFMQALLTKSNVFVGFKSYGVFALICFAFGALIASIAFIPQMMVVQSLGVRERMRAVVVFLATVSLPIVLFMMGALAVVQGIIKYL